MIADEPIPVRIPDNFKAPGGEAAEQPGRYKEDYYNTRRKNGHVYALKADPEHFITPQEFKGLASRKAAERAAAASDKDGSGTATPAGAGQDTKGAGRFFHFGKDGNPLSKAEVAQLREPLTAALKDDCKYLDEFLWWYSKDDSQPQIWGDLDDEEVETLVTVLLRRGERNAATATFVRNVVESHDYLEVAIITVPRFIKTTKQMGKRPAGAPRKKRGGGTLQHADRH